MARNPAAVMQELQGQLMADVRPYLELAVSRGESLQVVLFVNADGEVGTPKATITGRPIDKKTRPPISSLNR